MKNRTQKQIQRAVKKLKEAASIIEKESDLLRSDHRGYYGALIDNLIAFENSIRKAAADFDFLIEEEKK